jgi:hypothetical protein
VAFIPESFCSTRSKLIHPSTYFLLFAKSWWDVAIVLSFLSLGLMFSLTIQQMSAKLAWCSWLRDRWLCSRGWWTSIESVNIHEGSYYRENVSFAPLVDIIALELQSLPCHPSRPLRRYSAVSSKQTKASVPSRLLPNISAISHGAATSGMPKAGSSRHFWAAFLSRSKVAAVSIVAWGPESILRAGSSLRVNIGQKILCRDRIPDFR